MRLFIFRCPVPDTGLECDRNTFELKAVSDRIIDEYQERCFSVYGCVPISAIRYGIPSNAEPSAVVEIVETDDRGLFTLAWDSYGRAWKVSNMVDDHIWERDMDFDRDKTKTRSDKV